MAWALLPLLLIAPLILVGLGLLIDGVTNSTVCAGLTEKLLHLTAGSHKLIAGGCLLAAAFGLSRLPPYRRAINWFRLLENQKRLQILYETKTANDTRDDD